MGLGEMFRSFIRKEGGGKSGGEFTHVGGMPAESGPALHAPAEEAVERTAGAVLAAQESGDEARAEEIMEIIPMQEAEDVSTAVDMHMAEAAAAEQEEKAA